MLRPIDQILNLRGSELEIFAEFLRQINSVLVEDNISTNRLLTLLKDQKIISLHLDDHDLRNIDFIRSLIIDTLSDEGSVEFLTDKLNDYDSRYLAVTMLGWFRSKARSAIPKLTNIVGNSGSATGAAKLAIALIGEAEDFVFEEMQVSIRNENDGAFRELCDLVLTANYGTSATFIDILRIGAKSHDPNIREVVADFIGQLGQAEKVQLLPVLENLKQDTEEHVRQAAENSAYD